MSMPLAAKVRPTTLAEFVGQEHLLSKASPLRLAIEQGKPHSMILWGPPGSGKTTLAQIIAQACDVEFLSFSAVMSGIKEIREAVAKAQHTLKSLSKRTLLFVDEVHRFNKTQQDAFLPFVENGTIILIGATTENPSFELNNALLSRCKIYILKRLTKTDILKIIDQALISHQGYHDNNITFDDTLKGQLAQASDGDARQALNQLEILMTVCQSKDKKTTIVTEDMLNKVLSGKMRHFDKKGDYFYDQISALHKAVRGSSPDGALYWFARMIDGGCDPFYIARRIVRMASEDIGNADPRAMTVALTAWEVQKRLGSPEGDLALAQAVVYMACAPKSNAVYMGYNAAQKDVQAYGTLEVPIHIRNAPTSLMRTLGHGKEYRYDHAEPNAFAVGQTYFPKALGERIYYHPTERGEELNIKKMLDCFRQLKSDFNA